MLHIFLLQGFHLSHFFPQEIPLLGSGMSFYPTKPSYDVLHEASHHCRSDPCYSNLLCCPFGSWDLQLSFYNCWCLIRSPSSPPHSLTRTDEHHSPSDQLAFKFLEDKIDVIFVFSKALSTVHSLYPVLVQGRGPEEGINTSLDKGSHNVYGGQGPQGGSRGLVV